MTPPVIPPNPNPRSNITGLLAVFLITMGCLILVCVLGAGYLAITYGPELLNQLNATPIAADLPALMSSLAQEGSYPRRQTA